VTEPGPDVHDLVARRQQARQARDFADADRLREQIREAGWLLRDTPSGSELVPAPPYALTDPERLAPRWAEPDAYAVAVVAHVTGWPGDVARAVTALARHCGHHDYEVVLVADGADEETGRALEALAAADGRVHVLHLEPAVGFGQAMNLGLGQARGSLLVWLDPHVEATGDLFAPLLDAVKDPAVGLAGGWGVTSRSMLEFQADDGPEVDAVEGYLLAVPRALAGVVEVDPRDRYYRNADLDYSFAVRALGRRAVRVPVPANRHRHRGWHDTEPATRDRASRKNYDRFLKRWRARTDLLTHGFTGYHRHHHDGST
jgi:glycosyltransferase involved in cell wall biosynthesis